MLRKKRIVNGKKFPQLIKFFRTVFNAFNTNAHRYLVKKDKYLNCSCKGGNFGGIPCQHEIALCALKFKDPNLLYFAKRWEINYFEYKNEEVHENTSNEVVEVKLFKF